jgi:hypothetical protein
MSKVYFLKDYSLYSKNLKGFFMIKHLPLLLFIGLAFFGCQQEKNILSPENCIDESLISGDSVCYQIYAPVCGCNGENYSNDCYAGIAGVTEWTEGECN